MSSDLAPSIVFINRVYPPHSGASGLMLRDLAQFLSKKGYAITVLTLGERNETRMDGKIKVLSAVHTPSQTFYGTYQAHKKLSALSKKITHADCVISLTDPPLISIAAQKIAKRLKAKHIHWSHDVYPDVLKISKIRIPDFAYKILAARARKSLNACDGVVTLGKSMRDHYKNRGVSGQPRVIPNWFPFKMSSKPSFNRTSSQSHNAAFKSDIKDIPRFRVLYTGRMGQAHPHKTIFDAIRLLYKSDPDIEFVFVGDVKGLEKNIANYGQSVPPSLRILPFQPDETYQSLLGSGDVHLVSLHEDAGALMVPCKFYASLAAERPCVYVGPANNAITTIIQKYKSGHVIEQGKTRALAKAIQTYRHDHNTWFDAQHGAIEAAKHYNRNHSLKLWLDFIRKTLQS